MPSIAIEPFSMMYFIICGVVSTVTQTAFSSRSMFAIVPVPSICPDTICPPKRPPAAIARSRLTLLPVCSMPSDVRRIVSAMTSAVNVLPEIEVAVRQTPLTAILSPTFASCKTYGASIVRLSDFDAFRVARSVPTSSMIPVNIFPASPFDIEVRCRLRPAPSDQMQTGTHHLDPVRLCLPPGFSLPHHL